MPQVEEITARTVFKRNQNAKIGRHVGFDTRTANQIRKYIISIRDAYKLENWPRQGQTRSSGDAQVQFTV